MPGETEDLWPSTFGEISKPSPVQILRRQAALLKDKTDGLVHAAVRTRATRAVFVHRFFLIVPLIEYEYKLFEVIHDLALYPVTLTLGLEARTERTELHDEYELKQSLREILTSPRTVGIITTLIGQVQPEDQDSLLREAENSQQ